MVWDITPKGISHSIGRRRIILSKMIVSYATPIDDNTAVIKDSEYIHFIKVLRRQRGDEIFLTDGRGRLYKGHIDSISKKDAIISIDEVIEQRKQGHKRQIAIAPTKNIDRFEWMIEKCTEIGVTDFFPVVCKNSERKNIKPDRIHKKIISAMKQSKRLFLPVLHPLMKFEAFLESEFLVKNRYIAHCMEPDRSLGQLYTSGEDAVVLIGPEGDFTQQEIKCALDAGWKDVSLGQSRLRTETAAVVSCVLLNQ